MAHIHIVYDMRKYKVHCYVMLELSMYNTEQERIAVRPPVGPMCIPKLTFRLLEPLGVFLLLQTSRACCNAPAWNQEMFSKLFSFFNENTASSYKV